MSFLPPLFTKASGSLSREIGIRRGKIFSATLSMTYRCNLTCVTCGTWVRGVTDRITELTTQELLDLTVQLEEMEVPQVFMVGSEPLMRRDCLLIAETLRDKNVTVTIITNGTLISETQAEQLIRAGVESVIISIDAVGERHNRIRGQDKAYERAVDGLRRLQETKKRMNSPLPRLTVHATISAYNTDVLSEISGLSDELGVEVSFQLASETSGESVENTRLEGNVVAGREFVAREETFLPDGDGVRRIREFLKTPGIIQKHPSLSVLNTMSDDDIRHSRFPVKRCNVVPGEIMIDPYGEVYPCGHLDEFSYGNVKTRPLREIWNGARRRRMLEQVRSRLFPICRHCCQHQANLTFWQKGTMLLRAVMGSPTRS